MTDHRTTIHSLLLQAESLAAVALLTRPKEGTA